MKLFTNDCEGRFLDRPNRFVVHAETDKGIVRAHCPNPGRLEEILHPGRKLIFERQKARPEHTKRKTEYTLVAARYKRKIIPLYSTRANLLAREFALPRLFPDAVEIRPEAAIGRSRFDFQIRTSVKTVAVEVKACTLVEHGLAMFPDAPSSRGRRHVEELIGLNDYTGQLIFMVMHEDALTFTPNFHTDPDFAALLSSAEGKIAVNAMSVRCKENGDAELVNPAVPVRFYGTESGIRDSGIYFLLIRLDESAEVTPGSLGPVNFRPGYYLYAGSAKNNLSKRIARHKRKRKRFHWHIDYLLAASSLVKAYPIYTSEDLECRLARDISSLAEFSVPRFGCSDCSCGSHLFYFGNDPMRRQDFTDLLFTYRHLYAFDGNSRAAST